MPKVNLCILILFVLAYLIACGNNDEYPIVLPGEKTLEYTGVFLGPIKGLGYETPSITSRTGTGGSFQFNTGESTRFFIGDVNVGTTRATDILTTMELAGIGVRYNHPSIESMNRLLLTLDTDLDPSNGIEILPTIFDAGLDKRISFDLRYPEFDEQPDLVEFLKKISNILGVTERTLVTPGEAGTFFTTNIKTIVVEHIETADWGGHLGYPLFDDPALLGCASDSPAGECYQYVLGRITIILMSDITEEQVDQMVGEHSLTWRSNFPNSFGARLNVQGETDPNELVQALETSELVGWTRISGADIIVHFNAYITQEEAQGLVDSIDNLVWEKIIVASKWGIVYVPQGEEEKWVGIFSQREGVQSSSLDRVALLY